MSRTSTCAAQCDSTYARHQTFHPRYGWLKRAYDEVHHADDTGLVDDAHEATDAHALFYSSVATIRLGVGKNMVDAIRFWSNAARIIAEVSDPDNGRRTLAVPTLTGHALLNDDDGYDPYMERPGTWWAAHWLMHAPGRVRSADTTKCQLPSWWALLHLFPGTTFSQNEMVDYLVPTLEAEFGKRPNAGSVKKDVQAFIHAYARDVASRSKVDDLIDSPLRQLGLLEPEYGEEGRYRLVTGHKHTLPAEVAAWAVFDFLDRLAQADELTSRPEFVEHVAALDGSPSAVFRITESQLATLLNEAASKSAGAFAVWDDDQQGLRQLEVTGDYRSAADAALNSYYRTSGKPHPLGDAPHPDYEPLFREEAA